MFIYVRECGCVDLWKDGMLMRSDACEMDEEMCMDMYV